MGYSGSMKEIIETAEYSEWIDHLNDRKGKAIILIRIDRLALDGNPGVVSPVGEGVSELKIDFGPGYRIYFIERGSALIFLLAGGDKKTQGQDIQTALKLAREL